MFSLCLCDTVCNCWLCAALAVARRAWPFAAPGINYGVRKDVCMCGYAGAQAVNCVAPNVAYTAAHARHPARTRGGRPVPSMATRP
eukprot:scaffold22045_cov111-Isochrysis_galbana.AAC.7